MLQTLKQWLLKKPVKILLGLYVFYVLFSYLAINPLAKKLVPWIAEKQLASQASVGQVRFNPFNLSAVIDDFKLNTLQGAPLASFEQLKVDVELSGIFNLAWKLKEIRLQAPHTVIAINPDGSLNWDALIAKLNEDKSPPSDTIPRVVIEHLAILQGQILYKDAHRTTPFHAQLTPINFELDGFSTLPKDRGDYLIAAKFADNGGSLKWKGNMGVNPVASKGEVALENIAVAGLTRIVKDSQLPFQLQQGLLQAHFGYDLTMPNDQPSLALNGIALALDKLVLTLNAAHANDKQATAIALTQLTANLPKLTFTQQKQTQLTFEQLSIDGQQLLIQRGEQILLTVPKIAVQNIAVDLAKQQTTIAQILLSQGAIMAKRARDGSVDWQTAFAAPETKPAQASTSEIAAIETSTMKATAKETTAFAVNVAAVQLQDWSLKVEDQTFTHPLTLAVQDIDIGFGVNNADGQWSIQQLQTQLNTISLKSTAYKEPVATLKQIALTQGDIGIDKQQVTIDSIVLSGLNTEVIQPKQGALNWQSLLENKAPVAKPSKPSASKETSSDWAVNLGKLALNQSQLHIEDQTPSQPVRLDLEKVGLELRNLSLNLNKPLPVTTSFSVKQGGQFNTQGTLIPAPFKSTLNLKLNNLAFSPFAPYINQYAKLTLASGAASVSGKVSMQQQKAFTLNFNGGFQVQKLALNEEAGNAQFLAWEQLASDDVAFSLSPNKLQMGVLKVQHPAGKFIIHEDRTTNISRILRSADTAAPLAPSPTDDTAVKAGAPKPSTPASNGMLAQASATAPKTTHHSVQPTSPSTAQAAAEDNFPVTIETTRIQDAELEFADLSLAPQFGTKIHTLTGVINNISTNQEAIAQLELDGKVDEYGAAKIRGSLQPFKATQFTDVKLAFTNLEMNRLTPYSGKFAGRRIDSGKLSVDLEYKIKQRQLAGENKFVINKLVLGERVESKDAADLPLDLAIAILEDSDGVIDLDLPISGSLDDPQFSYGSIVWKAIKNVLTKIVTSPFRALGKLFGGSADNLDAIVFEAGNAELAPPEQEKLKAVGQALGKRLGLALTITPGYDTALDTRAIQEQTLRRKVAEEMGIALEPGQKAGPIDLTNPKVQKAIDSLYDDLTNKGLLKRLKDKLAKPEAGHYETAKDKLTLSIEVKESDLLALAQARGEIIQASLVTAGVDAQRMHIAKAIAQSGSAKTNVTQTKLSLEVNKQAHKADASETKAQ